MLDHYDQAMSAAPIEMAKLRNLVADSPAQSARADRMISLAQQRMSIADMRVRLMREGRSADAHAINPMSGKIAMDQPRGGRGGRAAEIALLEQDDA